MSATCECRRRDCAAGGGCRIAANESAPGDNVTGAAWQRQGCSGWGRRGIECSISGHCSGACDMDLSPQERGEIALSRIFRNLSY